MVTVHYVPPAGYVKQIAFTVMSEKVATSPLSLIPRYSAVWRVIMRSRQFPEGITDKPRYWKLR